MFCCCNEKSTTVKTPKPTTGGSGPAKKKNDQVGEEKVGFVDALPSGAEKCTVHHVYDGDTMTVNRANGESPRVRLLGIDAPELKEKEPFGAEGAEYLKQLCPQQSTCWLVYEKDRQRDKYDRLLAYVYLANPSGAGYYCANTCLVEEGFAHVYLMKDEEISLRLILLRAQQKAMERKKNVWSNVDLNKTVYTTRNGTAFHSSSCENVKNSNLLSTSVSAAYDRGLSPCRTCHPTG